MPCGAIVPAAIPAGDVALMGNDDEAQFGHHPDAQLLERMKVRRIAWDEWFASLKDELLKPIPEGEDA